MDLNIRFTGPFRFLSAWSIAKDSWAYLRTC